MEKKNMDIVDKIIDRLRGNEELPYREGAWERFRATKLKKKRNLNPLWVAAALCLLGVSVGYWVLNRQSVVDTNMGNTELLASGGEVAPRVEQGPAVTGTQSQVVHADELLQSREPIEVMAYQQSQSTQDNRYYEALPYIISSSTIPEIDRDARVETPELMLSLQRVGLTPREAVDQTTISLENHILAQDRHTMTVQVQEVNGQDKHFRLSDKLSLGLVVSPSTTDRRTNVGGGLLLSYNIGNRLSIRTGATFHQYEVGILKDPVQSPTMEVAKTSDRPLQAEVHYSSTSSSHIMNYVPLIPNVNAVSGNVQTIDIPVEAKYTVYKGFYASAGISYAAILNQKRYAHYVENVNTDPYAKGLPANEADMRSAVQPVTQVIESASHNVNPSGFGGFVNMSLGKEVKVGKSVSLSLEPYVKLPVGNFKRADMNYTNGGVRIITNF